MNSAESLPVDNWILGHEIASKCPGFKQDVEAEWVAEEIVSCYNCRYRRFIGTGIQCMKSLFPDD
ncbi:MAG: hypothetical protein KJ779_07170 [Firmicutes bacterium]|nr:hypothetical protein [Bacillota bacterium]